MVKHVNGIKRHHMVHIMGPSTWESKKTFRVGAANICRKTAGRPQTKVHRTLKALLGIQEGHS
jgi:hypothetical protein